MGKFRQISTELWPLIYVKILFPGSILSIIDRFSSNFVYEFIPGMSDLGLKMGKFCLISTELWPLIYIKILFPNSILSIY